MVRLWKPNSKFFDSGADESKVTFMCPTCRGVQIYNKTDEVMSLEALIEAYVRKYRITYNEKVIDGLKEFALECSRLHIHDWYQVPKESIEVREGVRDVQVYFQCRKCEKFMTVPDDTLCLGAS